MQSQQKGLECFIKKRQVVLFPLKTRAGEGGNDFVTNYFDIYMFSLMLLDISNLLQWFMSKKA